MTLIRSNILFLMVSLLACKAQFEPGSKISETPQIVPFSPIETREEAVFNFAEYVANEPKLKRSLSPLAAKDKSYLQVGDSSRFSIQTNAKVETIVNEGFSKNRNGMRGSFWVDSFVFSNKIGGNGKGSLVDMGIEGNERELGLTAYLRFLGQDRLAGVVRSAIDQVLTRSLTGDTLLYGSPILGLKVGGNIGGEIGLKADLDRNIDDSMVLAFTPKSGLNGGLTTKIEALSFARVELGGLVNLIDSSIVNQGTVGALKDIGVLLGDIGMDSGAFSALDGSIVIGASVGPEGVLPASVDKSLWSTMTQKASEVLKKYGKWVPDLKWTHSVWDPTPVFVKDLPEFSKPFLSFFKKPVRRADCEQSTVRLANFVREASKNIDRLAYVVDETYQKTNDPALKDRLRVLANVKTNYQVILGSAYEYCAKLN